MQQTGNTDPVRIYYDGDCPFCSRYVRLVRLREAIGQVDLIDVREVHSARALVESHGFDLDEGMLLDYDGRYYHGHDCINALALLSSPSGALNRLNAWIFRSPSRARLLYPAMRAGRNMTLRMLGKTKLSATSLDGDDLASQSNQQLLD